jgi:hypothetical protein
MPSEPNWSKQISSNSVCTWFFTLACADALIAVFAILLAVYAVMKKGPVLSIAPSIILGLFGFVNGWAFFLMCNRSIGKS